MVGRKHERPLFNHFFCRGYIAKRPAFERVLICNINHIPNMTLLEGHKIVEVSKITSELHLVKLHPREVKNSMLN